MRPFAKLPLLLASLLACAPFAQGFDLERLEKIDFKKTRLQSKDLDGLMLDDLAFLRGIVFGKRGRIFKDRDIQDYLETRSWYRPNRRFTNAVLTPTERANLDLIREAEAEDHDHVQPGDLRFWRKKRIPADRVDPDFTGLTELRIMRAEIQAIHGRRFPNEPMLQKYFEERYWYRPSAKYDPKSLNEFERANLALFDRQQKKLRQSQLQPSDMEAFESAPLSASQLKGMSLYDLRLARNWFYALRGHRFRTPWLAEFFEGFEWYKPLPRGKAPKLSAMDARNVATILQVEKRLHDDISRAPIKRDLLRGLYVEDLRKLMHEIPARHGSPFKDRFLRSYFSSMPWYKPNPRYRSSLLTKIERQNMAFLAKAVAQGQTQFDLAEG